MLHWPEEESEPEGMGGPLRPAFRSFGRDCSGSRRRTQGPGAARSAVRRDEGQIRPHSAPSGAASAAACRSPPACRPAGPAAGGGGGVSVRCPRPFRLPPPQAPAPHLPGLQLLRQRHLLADSAKQLPGERVPLQRDAAELQGQFQRPAGKRGRERVLGRSGLSERGWRDAAGTRTGVVPLTPEARLEGSWWVGIITSRVGESKA